MLCVSKNIVALPPSDVANVPMVGHFDIGVARAATADIRAHSNSNNDRCMTSNARVERRRDAANGCVAVSPSARTRS
jgi:hypothetical protein